VVHLFLTTQPILVVFNVKSYNQGEVMYLKSLLLALLLPALTASLFSRSAEETKINFTPINHATFVIQADNKTIYVDPIGGAEAFSRFAAPDIILITHTHADHLSVETVKAVRTEKTVIISPQAVFDQLKLGTVLNNGEKTQVDSISIEAIPMYNTTEGRLQNHPKGKGNGYLLTINGKRVYISGDTEDTPEMRALRNIDYAVICMNLPYTMSVEQAASAVLEMKPKVVIPYHYRGPDGMSDLKKFQSLVSKDKHIRVLLMDWYK
jgi:L-ascorbate metabolism protein UlaG (beta-lactamase superfamily)